MLEGLHTKFMSLNYAFRITSISKVNPERTLGAGRMQPCKCEGDEGGEVVSSSPQIPKVIAKCAASSNTAQYMCLKSMTPASTITKYPSTTNKDAT